MANALVNELRSRVSVLHEQIRWAHEFLEGTMDGVTQEQAHWQPPGKALPIGAHYGHVVVLEDFAIGAMLSATQPLYASLWAKKTGFSPLPPLPGPGVPGIPAWDEWARALKVDLTAARGYARAVHDTTDGFLAALADATLDRPLDLSGAGLGPRTVGWFLTNPVLANINMHCGEISCLKGLQGERGYPA